MQKKAFNNMATILINALALAATVLVNLMGMLGYFNGLSQKEVSDIYDTLITPGPSTFSIWGVIYTLLIATVILTIVKKADKNIADILENLSIYFIVSCIFNIAWNISFAYRMIGLSTMFIIAMLISLLILTRKLAEYPEQKLLNITFGIYGGWIFIATFVNFAAFMVSKKPRGYGGFGAFLAVVLLILIPVAAYYVLKRHKNLVFVAPIAWAYFGIENAALMKKPTHGFIAFVALALAIAMVVYLTLEMKKNNLRCIKSK